MGPLILEMSRDGRISSSVCVTAQHREMLDGVLDLFSITPDHDLNIMKKGQTLFDITGSVLDGLQSVFTEARPDLVLVHGDTTTTFAAALAAFYMKIPVGHVEAGLRTYNKFEPYPEEMNRLLTGRLADLNFAPTSISKAALLAENVPEQSIFVTGNTGVEAILMNLDENYSFEDESLNTIDYANKKIILMTAHRRENLGEPMENICRAVAEIMDAFPDTLLVWPVHPNPAVTKPAHEFLSGKDRVVLIDPVDVRDLHNLMGHSYLILTDSGGLQEEAPTLNKPVIVLREVTERPEGLKAGTLVLAGTQKNSIYNETASLLTNKQKYEKMANTPNPFGDGNASERIVKAILENYGM